MKNHILIHNTDPYIVASLLLYSLSAFSMAAWLYSRWFHGSRISFYPIYIVVLIIVTAIGLFAFGVCAIFGVIPKFLLFLIVPLAISVGFFAKALDRKIVRYFFRKRVYSNDLQHVTISVTARLGSIKPYRRQSKLFDSKRSFILSPQAIQFRFWPLVLGAIFEELIFRGVLVEFALFPQAVFWKALLLFIFTLIFSLSHIQFGWPHVFAKTPLGISALLLALIFSSAIPAIIVHVTFNILIWKELQVAASKS